MERRCHPGVHAALFAGLLVLALAPRPATASPKRPDLENYVALTDGEGHYLFVDFRPIERRRAQNVRRGGHTSLYFGTRKKLVHFDLEFTTLGEPMEEQFSLSDPRGYLGKAVLLRKPKGWFLRCDSNERLPLRKVSPSQARRVSRARIAKLRYSWRPWMLGRDGQAYYYLIEKLLGSNEKTLRLWRGTRASMKPVKLLRVANDPMGFLLVAKAGTLEYDRDGDQLLWRAEGRKEQLKVMNTRHNTIGYSFMLDELGVYLGTRFETPCEQIDRGPR